MTDVSDPRAIPNDAGTVAPELGDTVWVEREPFIDRIPRVVAMAGLFVFIVGIWWAATASGLVSPIILPGPGLIAFTAVVVLTMLASASFDPRLIWEQSQ